MAEHTQIYTNPIKEKESTVSSSQNPKIFRISDSLDEERLLQQDQNFENQDPVNIINADQPQNTYHQVVQETTNYAQSSQIKDPQKYESEVASQICPQDLENSLSYLNSPLKSPNKFTDIQSPSGELHIPQPIYSKIERIVKQEDIASISSQSMKKSQSRQSNYIYSKGNLAESLIAQYENRQLSKQQSNSRNQQQPTIKENTIIQIQFQFFIKSFQSTKSNLNQDLKIAMKDSQNDKQSRITTSNSIKKMETDVKIKGAIQKSQQIGILNSRTQLLSKNQSNSNQSYNLQNQDFISNQKIPISLQSFNQQLEAVRLAQETKNKINLGSKQGRNSQYQTSSFLQSPEKSQLENGAFE